MNPNDRLLLVSLNKSFDDERLTEYIGESVSMK